MKNEKVDQLGLVLKKEDLVTSSEWRQNKRSRTLQVQVDSQRFSDTIKSHRDDDILAMTWSTLFTVYRLSLPYTVYTVIYCLFKSHILSCLFYQAP